MLTMQHKKFGYGVTHEVEEKTANFISSLVLPCMVLKKSTAIFLEII